MSKQGNYQIKLCLYLTKGMPSSQSILLAFSDRFGIDEEKAKLISSTFGGGMGRLRQKVRCCRHRRFYGAWISL